AAVTGAVMGAARCVGFVGDSAKSALEHFARFGDLSHVDLLITDTGLSPEDARAIESRGTEVVRA
ncbi:D-beta-D-heptose 1-phosphate adenosyltransferase, partial [Streptomyces sp. NPDC058193]